MLTAGPNSIRSSVLLEFKSVLSAKFFWTASQLVWPSANSGAFVCELVCEDICTREFYVEATAASVCALLVCSVY